jgi:CubicO group peptidase (beta-lactamase class C family)
MYFLVFGVAIFFGYSWVSYPLFWRTLPYRIQAISLGFTDIQCNSNSPQEIKQLLKYYSLPNFSLAGKVIFIDSLGRRHVCQVGFEDEARTSFRLASMTKAVTAHAVLELAKNNRLELDSPLLGYFPEVNVPELKDDRLSQVTLAHLLNHSSGLGGPFGSDNMVKKGEVPWCPHDFSALERIHLAGQPGTNHVYSNVAYCLLGEVIARVTGETYREYVEEKYLTGTGLGFIDGGFLENEPDYDFSNELKMDSGYVDWLDFEALSSAAGLMGAPESFADMIHRRLRGDFKTMLNGPLVSDCGKGKIDRCYSWNFELHQDNSGSVLAGVQQGYMPGASSLLAITPEEEVLVWVAAGAPIENHHKDELEAAVVDFLAKTKK